MIEYSYMSNTKKGWNASKALKRSVDANKKTVKVKVKEAKERQKKSAKESYK